MTTAADPAMIPRSSSHTRLAAGLAAIGLGAGVGATAILTARPEHGSGGSAAAGLVATGLLALLAGLVARQMALVGLGVVALAGSYVAGHVHPSAIVPSVVVLLAPALLATVEVAAWSLDTVPEAADERGVHRDRARWLSTVVAASLLVALGLAALARVHLDSGLPLDAVSVAAALGLLAVVAGLVRR